jgi:hypothetical protein
MLVKIILLIFGYLMPLGALWVGVLCLRPAVARVRIERVALVIRDRVVDGILADDIQASNPRARRLMEFCEYLSTDAKELTFASAVTRDKVLRRCGFDLEKRAREGREQIMRKSTSLAKDAGHKVLDLAEHDLDRALSAYLVRGSALWWYLTPREWVRSSLSKHATPRAQHVADKLDDPSPDELATEVREAWAVSPMWVGAVPQPKASSVAGMA